MSDLAAALDIVGARWALLVVERLLDGPQRYGDLQRDLGVPTNMLATRLRELEAAGVLTRLPLRHNTRAYALTDRGLALREAIVALARWGGEEWPSHGAESRCAPTNSSAATAPPLSLAATLIWITSDLIKTA